MPTVTHLGYTFRYDETGVFPVQKCRYNFTVADCLEAMAIAQSKQAKLLADSNRIAYVYVGYGEPTPGETAYKIGSSYDPYTRLSNGVREILITLPAENRQAAFAMEYYLHRIYAGKRFSIPYGKEWFKLDEFDLIHLRDQSSRVYLSDE